MTKGQRGERKERFSIGWLTTQMPIASRARLDGIQEPETPSRSPTWVAGIQVLEPSFAVSRVCISRELDWIHVGIPSGSLTHCTTTTTLNVGFLSQVSTLLEGKKTRKPPRDV